jgi:hypothetical protein
MRKELIYLDQFCLYFSQHIGYTVLSENKIVYEARFIFVSVEKG